MPNPVRGRNELSEKLQALAVDLQSRIDADASHVASRTCEAGHQSGSDWLGDNGDDRDGGGRPLERRHKRIGVGYDHVRLTGNDRAGQRTESVILPLG